MCSYNQLNNSYACQNSKLLNGILKDELGFQGFVQSDWLAQRSGVASALAGLDMTMPGDGLRWQDGKTLWGAELTKAALNSSVPMYRLNDMAMRIVAAWYQLGQDSKQTWPTVEDGGGPNFSSWTDEEVGELHPGSPGSNETGVVNKYVPVRQTKKGGDHDALARKIATEGIVLVKNENKFLPLSRNGTGMAPKSGDSKLKVGIFGEDAFHNPDGNNACEDRACNKGTLAMGWGSGAVELPYLVSPAEALRRDFDNQTIELTEWRKNDLSHIDATASTQDICLVFVSSDAGEGYKSWSGVRGDRNDLYPQKGGDELVKKIASNCENTVVILHTVGPTVLEKWIDLSSVKSVIIAHLPGQESGNALANIIFGDVNPSGRLPYTIAKAEKDYGPTSGIMYYPNAVVPQQNFTEGLYIDYRYLDKHNVTPRYEFGYGLSYTSFQLSSLIVQSLGVSGSIPKARLKEIEPPQLDSAIPSPESALWPKGMRKLKKYIYPYIDSIAEIEKGPYPYPKGYDIPRQPSQAGGGEGGNPDLYTPAVAVEAAVSNLGSMSGDCVVQMYISYPPHVTDADGTPVDMPVRVLRGFEKIWVGVEEHENRRPVKFQLTRRDLSYWDVKIQNWVLPEGEFKVYLGFSSRNLEQSTSFEAIIQFNTGRSR